MNSSVLLQTSPLSIHLVQFVKCWRIFLGLKSKALYRSSEQKNRFLWFKFFIKRPTNSMAKKCKKKKKSVMRVQSFCFANLRGCLHEGGKIRPRTTKILKGKTTFPGRVYMQKFRCLWCVSREGSRRNWKWQATKTKMQFGPFCSLYWRKQLPFSTII